MEDINVTNESTLVRSRPTGSGRKAVWTKTKTGVGEYEGKDFHTVTIHHEDEVDAFGRPVIEELYNGADRDEAQSIYVDAT